MTARKGSGTPAETPGTRARERSELAPLWEVRVAWLLRGLIVLTAGVHLSRGQWLYSLLCLLALALMLVPPLLARSSRVNIPLEIELGVLWWLVTDMTLGRLLALYETLTFYDKIIHFGNSGLFAIIAFLAVYVLKMTCRVKTGAVVNMLTILFITLGIGAFWEILEFASDQVFGQGAQGSPQMAPLEDTMWDLIVDGLGGLLGGIFGAWYMKVSRRSLGRWRSFVAVVSG